MKLITKKIAAFTFALSMLYAPFFAKAQLLEEGGFHPDTYETEFSGAGLSTETKFSVILLRLIEWMLLIMIFLAVGAFVVAGIWFIVAGGAGQADTARKVITYAIVGLIVGLIGFVVVRTVDYMLKSSST